MDNNKRLKKDFDNYLNDKSPEQGSDKWIINGKIRFYHMTLNQYGTALRKFNNEIFNKAYNINLKIINSHK